MVSAFKAKMCSRIVNLIRGSLVGATTWPQKTLQDIFTKGCLGYSGYFSRTKKIDQIFGNTKIDQRSFFCNPELMDRDHATAMSRVESVYKNTRRALLDSVIKTAKESLDQAGLSAKDISRLIVTSELPACPPLDFEIANKLGTSTIPCVSLAGWGCAGGVGALAEAHHYVAQHNDRAVLVVGAEAPSRIWATQFPIYLRELIVRESQVLCSDDDDSAESLALNDGIAIHNAGLSSVSTVDPTDLQNVSADQHIIKEIVVAALVGDAVSAGIVVGSKHKLFDKIHNFPIIENTYSQIYSGHEHLVGATYGAYGTRMYLSPEIPKFMAQEFPQFLVNTGINTKAVKNWLVHPGGPKILQNLEPLGVSELMLKNSWDSLACGGNCLSVSILDVIARNSRGPTPGPCFIFGVGPAMRMISLTARY
jgi:predicted naringenin-chalcone synthase